MNSNNFQSILILKQALVLGPLIYSWMAVIHPALQMLSRVDRMNDWLSMPFQNSQEEFDFIIVGAGSSGCALASKLSEDYSVLLLEYGGSPSIMQYFPFYTFLLYNNPNIDWGHKTVPQKQASFGLVNNSVIWSNGKLLGGSSQLNAMMYVRGNVQGFDEIAAKTGDSRWSMENVLRYYKDMEDYHGWFDSNKHGNGGPLHLEKPQLAKLTDYLMAAGQELGYNVRDPNTDGPYTEGFAMMDLYMKQGRRADAYREFLVPIRSRRNLVIRKYAFVLKILFHPGTTVAYGVEYERHGQIYQARARNEVILSAGTLKSAKLLMLSGIGPKENLEEVGINPILDLPVGQYLQDKYGALIGPFLVSEGKGLVLDRDLTALDFFNWVAFGTGKLKSSLAEGTWAIYSDAAKEQRKDQDLMKSTPDIHTYILSLPLTGELGPISSNSFNFKPEITKFFSQTNKTDSFYQLVTINRQKGHGFVKLRDSNPYSDLVIDPKYLENEEDFKSLVEGLKFSVKLVENTTSFKQINGRLMPLSIPGCESFEFKSHNYFECLARQVTLSAFKYAGSAPVGRNASEPFAVVDSHLRVFGTKNLRIVDGSVLQQKYVSINDCTCRMLGLLASNIIKEDWNYYNFINQNEL